MDRKFICSAWEPAKCAIEFIWQGYGLGAMHIVDTDYENYSIRFSKANFSGINYMEAIWVDSRVPLEIGTQEYLDFVDMIETKLAKHIPSYPMTRLSPIQHTSDCKYQLTMEG